MYTVKYWAAVRKDKSCSIVARTGEYCVLLNKPEKEW